MTGRSARRILRLTAPMALSLSIAATMLAIVLPRLTGISWSNIGGLLLGLSTLQIAVLTAVWLAGLFTHTYVMVAALPSLGHRRAMMLNFSGSAVSNLVPFGGMLGMGVSYTMLRSWGFSRVQFTAMTVLTNTFNVLAKLLLPSLGLVLLVVSGGALSRSLVTVALVGIGLLSMFVVLIAVPIGVRRRRSSGVPFASEHPRRWWDPIVVKVVGSPAGDLRRDVRVLVRAGARRLTMGAIGYPLLQALLLGLCLRALGSTLSPVDVFAGYAIGAALTIVPITPGGIGVTEAGTAALLIALGGSPAATTAAVLLFRIFTFVLEIPAGAACTAVWWMRRPSSLSVPVGSTLAEQASTA